MPAKPKPTAADWKILARYGVTPDNLTVGWSLDLRGTAITALPDGLTVGWWLDLSDTAIPPLYTDPRGYRLDRAGDHYHAGCRRFTAAKAIAHWGSPFYPDRQRGAAYVAAVESEEARRKAKAAA